MTPEHARALLQGDRPVEFSAFEILQAIARIDTLDPGSKISQELLLRCLSRADEFRRVAPVLHQLAREHGLFPYVDQDRLDLREQIAFEFHKPGVLGERGVVFHGPQARIFNALMQGESIVLSAPTSFGKSLIIDALVLSRRFCNLLIVVPTIALMDETRRRLNALQSGYKTITHRAQEATERNVYVMTQERVIEAIDEIEVDFFAIDEFYKLSPQRAGRDDDRATILNKVFYRLASRRIPFYLLGPNVQAVTPKLGKRFECRFVHEPYETVVSELHLVDRQGDEYEDLLRLCERLEGPSIIYCRSPVRAAEVAEQLSAAREASVPATLQEAVSWIARHFHEEWHFTKALAAGVGVHHGRIPRSLAQYVVRAFEAGAIDWLVCTSTLIEGVNTRARNIVVFDNTVARSRLDFFTFNNIRGRSGRMFQHFVGYVYIFHDPPQEELPFIDIPSITQSDEASDGLLLELDEEELDPSSRRRTQRYRDQSILSIETIRANSSLEPETQLAMAATLLESEPGEALLIAGWSGRPSWEELVAVCKFIWETGGSQLGAGSVRSAKQLAYKIYELRARATIRSLIESHLSFLRQRSPGATADEAVQNVLDFQRLWANFHFPRLLSALDRIQQEVLPRMGLQPGSLTAYAGEVENLFLGAHVLALEEFGLPLQIGSALPSPKSHWNFDEYLRFVQSLDPDDLGLESFERELFYDLQKSLVG